MVALDDVASSVEAHYRVVRIHSIGDHEPLRSLQAKGVYRVYTRLTGLASLRACLKLARLARLARRV